MNLKLKCNGKNTRRNLFWNATVLERWCVGQGVSFQWLSSTVGKNPTYLYKAKDVGSVSPDVLTQLEELTGIEHKMFTDRSVTAESAEKYLLDNNLVSNTRVVDFLNNKRKQETEKTAVATEQKVEPVASAVTQVVEKPVSTDSQLLSSILTLCSAKMRLGEKSLLISDLIQIAADFIGGKGA